MGQSLLNNYSFFLDGDITLSTTTVPISNDIETNTVVTLVEPADVIFIAEDGSQVERMIITAAAGVMTLGTRAIKNDNSGTTDVSLKRKRYAGQKVTLTILAHHVVGLGANNVFTGDNTFAGDHNTFTKGLPGTVFANDAARDAVITAPYDGLIVYNNTIEDYQYYRNGARVSGFGGGAGGGGVRYKDSTSDGTITGAINGVNVTYNLSNTPGSVNSLILTFNGVYMEKDQDYTIIGNIITFTYAPISGKLVAIYPTVAVGASAALTRATDDSGAINGELYRSTNDNQSLYYKDNGGDSIKLIDITTNKLNENLLPDSVLPTNLVLGENMSALDIATFGINESIYKYIGSYFTNTVGTYSGTIYLQDYFMVDTNKIVFLYIWNEGWSTFYHYAVVGTINGATITLGTPLKYYTGGNRSATTAKGCKLDTNKFVAGVASYSGSVSADDVYAIVCTISGTTITSGTPVGMKTTNFSDNIYDIIKVATDKFVVRGEWDNATTRAICCSVVGTTITKGALANITGLKLVYVSDDIFLSTNGSNVYRATISGTTTTEGNNLDNTNLTSYGRVYVDSTRQILTGLSGGNLVSVVINGTPTTPTQGSYFTIRTSSDSNQGACLIGTNKIVYNCGTAGVNEFQIVAILDTNSINKQVELQISSTTPIGIKPINIGGRYIYKGYGNGTYITNYFTLPSEYNSVFGFLSESGNLGDSKQISMKGSVLSGFTGLIPGIKYYINSSFVLSTSNASGVGYGKELGLALTSTKLLVTV